MANLNVEFRFDIRTKIDIKIQQGRLNIFLQNKKKSEITLIGIGITNLDLLTRPKYDLMKKRVIIYSLDEQNSICNERDGLAAK